MDDPAPAGGPGGPGEAADPLRRHAPVHRRGHSSYDPKRSSPATWLTALCRNAAFDRLRQLQRQGTEEISEHHPDPAPGPEELLLQKERRERLQTALNALSARDRNLIYRKYYYLQSTARMAAELGLTERAVEGRLYRIRQKLQKKLGGELL